MNDSHSFLIDLHDQAGAAVGPGPISTATAWRSTARMDRAGSFSFDMPAADPMADHIAPKRVATCYAMIDGQRTQIGGGVIDAVSTTIDDSGAAWLAVSGGDLVRELSYRSVGFLELSDGNGGGVSHASAVASLQALAPPGWSFIPASAPANNEIYARFAGETILAAAVAIADASGCHFHIEGGRDLVFSSAAAASGVRAVAPPATADRDAPELCTILDLSTDSESYDQISRIYPFGAGQGRARLDLAATDRSAPTGYTLDSGQNYIASVAAEAEIGRVERWLEFKNIAPISNTDLDLRSAANALFDAALMHLERSTSPTLHYKLRVQAPVILRPGHTIRCIYRSVVDGRAAVDIDADLYIIEAAATATAAGVLTTDLLVGTVDAWPASGVDSVVSSIAEGAVYQSHPQLNANAYTTGYTHSIDADNGARFRFRFGDEVTQVQQALFEFQILPLESTIKTIAGEITVTDTQTVDYTGAVESTASTGDMSTETSGAPSAANTGSPSQSATGQAGGGNTGQAGVGNTGSSGGGNTGSAGGGSTGQGGGGSTGYTGGVTGTPSSNVTSTPSNNTSGTPSNNTSSFPSQNTSGTPSNNASGTPSNNTSGGPNTTDTGQYTGTVITPEDELTQWPLFPSPPSGEGGAGSTGVSQGEVDANGRHAHGIGVSPTGSNGYQVYFSPNGDNSYFYCIGATGTVPSNITARHTHEMSGHNHSVSNHHHTMPHAHSLAHSHNITHTHNLNNHTHNLNNHTHNLNNHTHNLNNHTHGLNNHTHDLNNHTHGMANHTHTGPLHTHTGPLHTHSLTAHTHSLTAHTHSLANHSHSLSAHTHTIAHAHNMRHTHDISHSHRIDHSHTFTPLLSTTYGVYREAAAATFEIGDLEYSVNSGGWSPLAGAVDAGGGWYSLDVTAAVADATTQRPLQAGNILEIRRRSGGASLTASIDALLSIRNIIQAIAYT